VELELTAEQDVLRQTTSKYIEAVCPLATVRELVDTPLGLPPGYLPAAGELGWFAMLVADADGGGDLSGRGLHDLAIVAEERGRAVQPGPFVSANVVAWALAASGSDEQRTKLLPPILAGRAVATWVVADAAGRYDLAGAVTATGEGEAFELTGRTSLVQDGATADWLLVTTTGPEGLTQFVVDPATPGVTVTPLRGHDITGRLATVDFDQVKAPATSVLGLPGHGAADAEHQLQLAAALITVETVGALDALLEMTCRYAKDRIAFGRPIGSFQAVKHELADISLAVESSKAVAAAAVRAVAAGRDDAGEVVSIAKSWVGDAGIDVAQGCFQVFGGIGYTWDHDLHLYLRRITMNALLFGQPDWHRERICRIHQL
jgi:alkylation response protein AidB-like acyl-CoA dehydrogenase